MQIAFIRPAPLRRVRRAQDGQTDQHRQPRQPRQPRQHGRSPVPGGMAGRRIAAVGVLFTLTLSGCSGGTPSSIGSVVGAETSGQASSGPNPAINLADSTGSRGASGSKSVSAVPPAGTLPAQGRAVDAATPGAPVPGAGAKLTKSAGLDLQVHDIAAAAARVRSTAAALQAHVLSEQIGKGAPGDPVPLTDGARAGVSSGEPGDLGGFGTLTLSVPADKLDTTLDQLAKLGTVLRRNTSSQDVTAEFVDTESRLKTMRASVDRVRALMARAKDIGQVVALESEMSRRQADLESLESQLSALKGNVERSTVAVSLSTPGNEPVADSGFVAGLRSGWDAFTASASGLFRAIGATLPFALFLSLAGAPLWWTFQSWRRRRASRRSGTPAPAPTS